MDTRFQEYTKIRPRRGSFSEWQGKNPILLRGELAIEYPDEGIVSGNVRFKLGDGETAWNNLPYCIDPSVAENIDGGTPTSTNVIAIKKGTTAQWIAADPVLEEGEIVFDTTKGEIKVGDGTHRFSELRYVGQTWEHNNIYDFGNYDDPESLT